LLAAAFAFAAASLAAAAAPAPPAIVLAKKADGVSVVARIAGGPPTDFIGPGEVSVASALVEISVPGQPVARIAVRDGFATKLTPYPSPLRIVRSSVSPYPLVGLTAASCGAHGCWRTESWFVYAAVSATARGAWQPLRFVTFAASREVIDAEVNSGVVVDEKPSEYVVRAVAPFHGYALVAATRACRDPIVVAYEPGGDAAPAVGDVLYGTTHDAAGPQLWPTGARRDAHCPNAMTQRRAARYR
jgi:hypothetical protein